MQRFSGVILLKAYAEGLQRDNLSMWQLWLLFKCVFPEIPESQSFAQRVYYSLRKERMVVSVSHRAFAKLLKKKTQKTNRGVLNLQVAIHIVLHKNLLGKKKQNQVPVQMILQPYKKNK